MQAPEVSSSFGRIFHILAWTVLLVVLFWFFQDYLGKQQNPNQQLQSSRGNGEIITQLTRNRAGHYLGVALINGQRAEFLLDTGATTVAVSERSAALLGMQKGQPIRVATANGISNAWRNEIAELQLGDIVLYQVPASIVPNLGGTEILLGMSALKQLEFRQQGNQLTLIQPL
ncbi:aspartyl protease [Alishewanella agri BL06]|uniref:Aspartyl protease n=1 Tax=Alishewanella agri BL06 TaxID=1195246 RepID=I9NZT5_9ALTE|nr:TIGR02281 family clan AA aspartic protease [Alishewanella agri]EIW88132.1 aspartyl protease [Alishewanella agri BL06]